MIETKSARWAITLATLRGHQSAESDHALYGRRIQRGRGTSTAGEVAHGVDCGRVLAAVGRQREVVRLWLMVAYAEPPWEWISDADPLRLHDLLCEEAGLSTGREQDVAMIAIDDMRQRVVRQKRLSQAEYCRRIGLDKSAYPRLSASVDRALNALDEIEAEGLKEVRQVIDRAEVV